MGGRLRVLLVEDDTSLQRFVAMALEDEAVRLQACTSVDEALLALAAQGFDLVITDLMMPGRSGHDLLAALQQRPALRGAARLAVFSAGLNATVRQQLEGLGVSRFLSKPCSLADLRACVSDLRTTGPAPAAPSPHRAAIDTYFGGNGALYQAYLARCREQFPLDLASGHEACARGDTHALRLLAHSLKSVLQTLGHADASDIARRLEEDARAAHAAGAMDARVRDGWARLDDAMRHLD